MSGPRVVTVRQVLIEGEPIHVCRIWCEGDERRGLRGVSCCIPGCPHTVAVSPGHFTPGRQYMCQFDAHTYGLPGGIPYEGKSGG